MLRRPLETALRGRVLLRHGGRYGNGGVAGRVLRPDAENVDWTGHGAEPGWSAARRRALDELHLLIAA